MPLDQLKRIDKKDIEDVIALTPMQEGMLFDYFKEPVSDLYFEQLSLEISGKIDKQKFAAAWNFVIDTNEILRTVFRWEKLENPVQIILKEHKIQLKYYDFSNKNLDEKQKWLEKIVYVCTNLKMMTKNGIINQKRGKVQKEQCYRAVRMR